MSFIFEKDADGYQHPARGRVPLRAVEAPQPTFDEILADERPLDLFLDGKQKEKARVLQVTRRLDFLPGGALDETTPEGREGLMLELGFVPEDP